MRHLVNLLVDLDDERFGPGALAEALRAIEAAGYTVMRGRGDDRFWAWLDETFGGTWSSEAYAGSSVIAKRGDAFAGFATYDPQGLRFSWLRGWGAHADVGIFGPFGVAPQFRGSPAGPSLLVAALASLRERGYARALIPAVGEEKLVEYYVAHGGARVVERIEKARWLERRYRTTVLASGNGTNLQAVLDGVREGRLPLDLNALVTNNPQARAIERARAADVPALLVLPWERGRETRAQYDARLLEHIGAQEPELVLLLGWMHLLAAPFVERFTQTINIHPAFLPLDQTQDCVGFADGTVTRAYRGSHAVRDALAQGSRWVGATAHRVTLEADRGGILVRRPLAVAPGESVEQVFERLHPLEHAVLAGGIMRWVYER